MGTLQPSHPTTVVTEYILKGEETLARRNHGHLSRTISEVFHLAPGQSGCRLPIPHNSAFDLIVVQHIAFSARSVVYIFIERFT